MDSFPLMNWVKSWTTLRQFERLTVSPLVIHLNTVREHCNLFDLQNIIIKVFISPECPILNIEAKPHQDPEVV